MTEDSTLGVGLILLVCKKKDRSRSQLEHPIKMPRSGS